MIEAMTKSPETLTEVHGAISPKVLFEELRRGVLGQDRALRFASVAIHKHLLGKVSGNILLIGSSGTGKTTIMNNIQRLYDTVPGFENFRAVTILNANLLVDSDRTEFRPDRMFSAIEQRARVILGERPSLAALKETMERATVCVDWLPDVAQRTERQTVPPGCRRLPWSSAASSRTMTPRP